MKIIIDECVPSIVKTSLIDRDIVTVQPRTQPRTTNNEQRTKLVEETYRIQEFPSTILLGSDAKVLVHR